MSYSDTVAYGLCLLLLGFLIGYLVGFKIWYGRNNDIEKGYIELCRECRRLQEQLKEANDIITGEVHLVKRKDDAYVCECPEIVNYIKKWGVK